MVSDSSPVPPFPPVRQVLVIGIGAGDPSLVTVQAVEALGEVDTFLVFDKGEVKADLAVVRQEVLRRFATAKPFRVVEVQDPVRDVRLPYEEAVARWHLERVVMFERVLLAEVADGECVGILVWGDPSLYDSTLRIIDQVIARGRVAIEHTVVPGISSMQLLAARHRISLNRIGRSVLITTGRKLRLGLAEGVDDDVVVMLDGETSFIDFVGHGFEIFWGAYLGSADEILIAGLLDEVADEIVHVRKEARRRKGWIFDIYLLRRVNSA